MKNKYLFRYLTIVMGLTGILAVVTSCQKEEPQPSPFSHFDYAIDDANALKVNFTNYSKNATSYQWDFGDSQTSSEENPSHEYATFGTYVVTLTATNDNGDFDKRDLEIEIGDPDAKLKQVTSATSKKWILQREGVALGIYAPDGGPWWEFAGAGLAERPCVLDDEITFNFDGTVTMDTKNTVWLDTEANGGWNDALGEGCHDESEAGVWAAADGTDVSDFANGGDYTFTFDSETNLLVVSGSGFYIGLSSKTNNGDNPYPISSKTYEVTKYIDGEGVDSLQLTMWLNDGASWKFNLVSYDDFTQAPEVPMPPSQGLTDLLLDNETATTYEGFGGSVLEIVDNPDQSGINTSNKVLKVTHGNETWAGLSSDLGALLDFSGKTKLKVKLWAPATGTLKYKIEIPGGDSQEMDLNVDQASQWVELVWDLSTDINGNAVQSKKYSRVVLFPGWNTTTPDVYYIDDITME